MPYRALTHRRVSTFTSAQYAARDLAAPLNAGERAITSGNTQAIAINSSNGIENSGSVISQRNKNKQTNVQPRRFYTRTLSTNFLMKADAFGPSTDYLKCKGGKSGCGGRIGEGKGFPNAMPQTSVGSTNVFARRAIARRTRPPGPDTTTNGCVPFDSSSKSY